MRKLGLHSVSELVLYAVRNNIVQVTVGVPYLPACCRSGFDGRCSGRPENVKRHVATDPYRILCIWICPDER